MNRDRLALTALVLLLTLPALGARDLWNPNEPTYGLAVREMIATDSWLIPTVNGERFLEKPPLYFWLARGASALFGEAPFALRLPSVLAAWLGVLSVFSIARRFGERRSGWIAAGVFFSLAAVAQTARQVQMDLLLTSCVAAALALAMSEKRGRALLAGLALGAGVLAKGPVAILAFGLPWLTLRLPWRRLPEVTLGLMLAVTPWLTALAIRGELGVLNEMFFRQSVMRYLDAWDHAQPAWYYLKYLWIDFAPWSWLLPFTFGVTLRRKGTLWSWLIGWTLFLSLSSSKRSVYLMPAAPAVALLVGNLIEEWLDRRARWGMTLWQGTMLLLVLAIAVAAQLPSLDLPSSLRWPLTSTMVAAALFAVAARLRYGRTIAATLIALCVAQAVITNLLLPQIDERKSAAGLAAEIKVAVDSEQSIDGYRLWRWRADYAYYLERELGRVESVEALNACWAKPTRCCLLVEDGRFDEVEDALGSWNPIVERAVGSKRVALICSAVGAPE